MHKTVENLRHKIEKLAADKQSIENKTALLDEGIYKSQNKLDNALQDKINGRIVRKSGRKIVVL